MGDASFGREWRMRAQADFDRAYQARLFATDDVLVVNASPNGLTHSRLGLSISKKAGNAVARNRWKRLIREAFRLEKDQLPAGLDLVVRPQKGAVADLDAIRRSLPALGQRIARRVGNAARPSPSEGKPSGERRTTKGERGTSAP